MSKSAVTAAGIPGCTAVALKPQARTWRKSENLLGLGSKRFTLESITRRAGASTPAAPSAVVAATAIKRSTII